MRLHGIFSFAFLSTTILAAACSSAPTEDDSDTTGAEESGLSLDQQVKLPPDVVNMGQLVYIEHIPSLGISSAEKQGFLFTGVKGDGARIFAAAANSLMTVTIFGPGTRAGIGPQLVTATSQGVGFNAIAATTLPANGIYAAIVTISGNDQVYSVTLDCPNKASRSGCLPTTSSPMSFGRSRITQPAIDRGRFSGADLFAMGDFLFEHNFTVAEGLGNALTDRAPGGPNARPNLRKIHNGKFGGPDSTNCSRCHLVGGRDGGGDLVSNLFQDGDGVNQSSALVRNPPQLLGAGYLQQLGIEMTQDLQQQLADAKTAAQSSGTPQTVALTSKGVSFGTIVVPGAGGTVDFSKLEGVDTDLVVKPLGWKGRVASVRRFVEGGFQVHLGMQTDPLIAKHCKTPTPEIVGTGPDCNDPDMDGVKNEITEGQLTAMATYGTLQQVPVRIDPTDPTQLSRVQNGEFLFTQVGCANCHQPTMELNSPIHLEPPDLSGGAPLSLDLTLDGRPPTLQVNGDGVVVVELYSDLKRHAMGATLADPHASFGTIAADQFITPPLWGVANTAPYMHDGRSPDLFNAINAHDGEGKDSSKKFFALDSDSQHMVIEFLQTLTRDPAHIKD